MCFGLRFVKIKIFSFRIHIFPFFFKKKNRNHYRLFPFDSYRKKGLNYLRIDLSRVRKRVIVILADEFSKKKFFKKKERKSDIQLDLLSRWILRRFCE